MAESLWHSLGHFTAETHNQFTQNYILDSTPFLRSLPIPHGYYNMYIRIYTYMKRKRGDIFAYTYF